MASSVSAEITVVHEGWLWKRGEHIRNWRRRYFILKSNGQFIGFREEPTKDTDLYNPTNNFSVKNCQVLHFSRPKPFTFCIRCLQNTTVVLRMFHVETDYEREVWCKHIELVRSSLQKVQPKPSHTKLSLDHFVLIKVLGKGTFGKVLLCREKSTNLTYAIKVLKKETIIEKQEVVHTLTEQSVLQKTNHPFMLSLKYSFTTNDRLCLVTEYLRGGELYFHLSADKTFSIERTRFYAAEIVSAIGYLHQRGIIYRDIKLENLLLDGEGHIKIADFGLCKENMQYDVTSTFCGTPEYLAPEMLLDHEYGRAVDWWSLGVVMYEMICGRLPFYNENKDIMFSLITETMVRFPSTLPGIAIKVLSEFLEKDPRLRLGGKDEDYLEIMPHPFFASIDWPLLEERKLKPPFIPKLESDLDTRYFSPDFTGEPIELTPPKYGAGGSGLRSCGSEHAAEGAGYKCPVVRSHSSDIVHHSLFSQFSYQAATSISQPQSICSIQSMESNVLLSDD